MAKRHVIFNIANHYRNTNQNYSEIHITDSLCSIAETNSTLYSHRLKN